MYTPLLKIKHSSENDSLAIAYAFYNLYKDIVDLESHCDAQKLYFALVDKLNLQNCNKFFIEDRYIIEGYSSHINNYIVMNNRKINIQISVSNGVCLIGSPVIKKSF